MDVGCDVISDYLRICLDSICLSWLVPFEVESSISAFREFSHKNKLQIGKSNRIKVKVKKNCFIVFVGRTRACLRD